MNRNARLYLCILATLAVTSALPAASIDIVFVDRILTAHAEASVCGGEADFEHLVNQARESLAVEVSAQQACAAATAGANAWQQSALGAQAIHATGECTAVGQTISASHIQSSATNMFQLNVDLSETTPFTFSGVIRAAVQAAGNSSAVVVIQLAGPSGQMLLREIQLQSGADEQPFLVTGTLAPGSYSLFASMQTRVDANQPPEMSATAAFDYLFATTSCLGDLDSDQQVGLSDLAALLTNFGILANAEFEDGDFDADGDVDLSDLSRLLSAFGADCR